MSAAKRTYRKSLTLREKVAILKAADGRPHRQLAEIFNIGRTQIRSILLNKDEILRQAETLNPNQMRQLSPHKSVLNEQVYQWYTELLAQNQHVTGPMIKGKATQVAAELELFNFTASDGWLSRFKSRHLLLQQTQNRRSGQSVQGSVEVDASLPTVLQGFAPRDVFTLDETSLLYRAMPDKAPNCDSSDPNERITLLFCVNFKGEFQKSLAIGTSLHPPCFRTLDRRDLPLTWRASKEALMTKSIFWEWVSGFNNRMQLEDRHVILLLKVNQSHPDTIELSNIKMEFLSASASSILHQGLMQHMKVLYRKQLLEYVIQGGEALSGCTNVTIADIVTRVNFHHALAWLDVAMKNHSPDLVQKCFHSYYGDAGTPACSLQLLDCSDIQDDSLALAELCHDACVLFNIPDPMAVTEYCDIDTWCPTHSEVEDEELAANKGSQDDADSKEAKPVKMKKSYRKSLTLRQKVAIIQAAEGRTHRQLADSFEIGKSQVWNILQKRDEILAQFTLCPDSNIRRVRRNDDMAALDANMLEWYNGRRSNEEKVTGVEIRTKALEIAAELGLDNFCASSGWLTRFKNRHHISERRVPDDQEKTIVVIPLTPSHAQIPELLESYAPKDVFTMGEAALLYRALPDKTLTGDATEERLTFTLCVNFEGEFQKSVLIGQRKCPSCFRSMDRSLFPLAWRAHRKALMTSELFQEWVMGFNNRMLLQNRHVLLLLKKELSHPRRIALSNVKMVFLPHEATSILNQGIVKQIKGFYRQQLLQHFIRTNGADADVTPVKGISDEIATCGDNVSVIASNVIDSIFNDNATANTNPEVISDNVTSVNLNTMAASGYNVPAIATDSKSGRFNITDAPYTTINIMQSINARHAITWLDRAIGRISLKTVQDCFHHCNIYPGTGEAPTSPCAVSRDSKEDERNSIELAVLCQRVATTLKLPQPMTVAEYCELDIDCPVHDDVEMLSSSGSSDNELGDLPDDISEVDYEMKPPKDFLVSAPIVMDSPKIHSHDSTGRYQAALCQQLWCLRSEGIMCDVVFDIGGEVLHAHRVVLSACSPYLKARCLSPTTMSQDGLVQIKVEHYSYKVCLKLIEFLYTGKLLDSPLDEFWQLCNEWQIIGMTVENDEAYSDDGIDKRDLGQRTVRTDRGERTERPFDDGSIWEPKTPKMIGRTVDKRLRNTTKDSKKSQATSTSRAAQNNFTSDRDLTAPPPPLLTEEWISSCFKDDNTSTENQQLYEGDSGDNTISDMESDSNRDPEFTPRSRNKTKGKAPSAKTGSTKGISRGKSSMALRAVSVGARVEPRRKRSKAAKTKLLSKIRNGECPVCGDMFDTPAKLYLHKATVHRNKQNGWCKICKLRFPDKNKLQVHNVANHFQEGMELPRLFFCQEENCAYSTYCRKSMFSHKKIVHQAERSICDLCGKSLKSEASLKQHHKHMHDDTFLKDYPCLQCDKLFKSYAGLSRHMVSIHAESGQREKHICPHCGYTAFTGSTMTEHLFKKHDILPPKGKPSFQCKHCSFKTTKIRDIKNHELRHEPEKRFKCEQCTRCYPTQREVNRHRRLKHSKNKQEIQLLHCDQCEYTTKYGKAALRSHISVKHEESRPWICSICSYRTKLKGNLHKHIRNVHKCEVKTNWTLTKVAQDGQCSESYSNTAGRTLTTPQASDVDTDEEVLREVSEIETTTESSATTRNLLANLGGGGSVGGDGGGGGDGRYGTSMPHHHHHHHQQLPLGVDIDHAGTSGLLVPGMQRFAGGNLPHAMSAVPGTGVGRAGVGMAPSQYDLLTSMGAAPPSLAHLHNPAAMPSLAHMQHSSAPSLAHMQHPDQPLFSHHMNM